MRKLTEYQIMGVLATGNIHLGVFPALSWESSNIWDPHLCETFSSRLNKTCLYIHTSVLCTWQQAISLTWCHTPNVTSNSSRDVTLNTWRHTLHVTSHSTRDTYPAAMTTGVNSGDRLLFLTRKLAVLTPVLTAVSSSDFSSADTVADKSRLVFN